MSKKENTNEYKHKYIKSRKLPLPKSPIHSSKERLNFGGGEIEGIVMSNLPDKHILFPFSLQISFCCCSQF